MNDASTRLVGYPGSGFDFHDDAAERVAFSRAIKNETFAAFPGRALEKTIKINIVIPFRNIRDVSTTR